MTAPSTVDADRVIADLRELARRTSNSEGAQRVAWTETWREARSFLAELLDEIGADTQVDEAGNLWASSRTLGSSATDEFVAVGSHLDSVPNGGWLDGALGVMAAVGTLRVHSGRADGRGLVLVDWADEEGARFGSSLFGSSAFAGELDPGVLADLEDEAGVSLRRALAENEVNIERAPECASRRGGMAAYLELHIEQGPVLEAEGVTLAAVEGCQGIERHRFTFTGQAAHAGTTPMAMRRDAGLAAAELAVRVSELPAKHGGVATCGEIRLEPGISTAVAGSSQVTCDLRHPDSEALAIMLESTREAAAESAAERGCQVAGAPVFRIEPTAFDPELVELARKACLGATGDSYSISSGALHDAAQVARVVPAAMMFCPSRGGVSHAQEEDTAEADLRVAIEAFGELVSAVVER